MQFDGVTFELTIVPDYVSDWGFKEAVRELIQNGLDEESQNPEHKFSMEYNQEEGLLIFRNKNTSIPVNSLLLGKTGKKNSKQTIGQFGEGYKIAALVLTRINRPFSIINGAKNEKWTASFSNSKYFNEDVLTFRISKNNEPTDDLIICIDNVSDGELESIDSIWLDAFSEYQSLDRIETEWGDILKDDYYNGNVYVNGLFIENREDIKYGYNFKPEYIQLERDRSTCKTFNMYEATSQMMCEAVLAEKITVDEFIEVINTKHDAFFSSAYDSNSEVKNKLIEAFNLKYTDGIPVDSQEKFDFIKSIGGNPVFISSKLYEYIKDVADEKIEVLSSFASVNANSIGEKLRFWFYKYCEDIDYKGKKEFYDLLKEL